MKICPVCGTTYEDSNVFCPVDGGTLRAQSDDGGLIGTVIADRYLVTGKLGHGGMGAVYLAQHVRLPQRVAIKVLHRSLTFDSDSISRFNREAQHASSINNEHVARIYDFGEVDGMAYLAMEFVEGETLREFLQKVGAIGATRVVEIVRQIADGLDAAHKLGIVHRDLKPENILISTDSDGTDRVKIVDFGIAKATQSGQTLTQTGLAIGTAEFMSPEQVAGELVDRRTDVYALGLVTFVMLTGSLPFQGPTREMSMLMRLTQPPRTLAEMRPDLDWPPGLQETISKALEREVSARHESAGEFARALGGALARERRTPPVAALAFATEKSAQNTRRRPAIIGGVMAVVFIVILVFAWPRGGNPPTGVAQGKTDSLAASGTQQMKTDSSTSDPKSVAPLDSGTSVKIANTGASAADAGGKVATRSGAGDARSDSGARGKASATAATGMSDVQVKAVLDSTARLVDVTRGVPSESDAQMALSNVTRVLPQLRLRSDSADFEMLRVEALLLLKQTQQACNYIATLLPRANRDHISALQHYRTQFSCGGDDR
jgi:serine/threonine-protein kinase